MFATGPIARIGPNAVVSSSPEVWIHVNTKPGYKRSDWYFHAARVEHRRDNIFSQTNTELHDQRRKQIAPGVRVPPPQNNITTPPPHPYSILPLNPLFLRNKFPGPFSNFQLTIRYSTRAAKTSNWKATSTGACRNFST